MVNLSMFNKITFLNILCLCVFWSPTLGAKEEQKREVIHFKSETHSLIDFEDINLETFNSYHNWLIQRRKKDLLPNWEVNLRESKLNEIAGRVIGCSGVCQIYRDNTYHQLHFRSKIIEGDELRTIDESYLWIFLYDGTIVRLAPKSSLSLKEINIGIKRNFLHARINAGNILWLSRINNKLLPQDKRETDTIFFPMEFKEAQTSIPLKAVDEKELFDLLDTSDEYIRVYRRLNLLIGENNKNILNKKTFNYLVTPNGTIRGEDLLMDFIVLTGKETYIKNRKLKILGIENELENEQNRRRAILSMRGFENTEIKELEAGGWYKIDKAGREVEEYNEPREFRQNEFVTRRIPSIFIARELLLKNYSDFAFRKMGAFELGERYGYRQWEKYHQKGKDDLSLRIKFLDEFIRRKETQHLVISSVFARRLEKRGIKNKEETFGNYYFRKALGNYAGKREDKRYILEQIDYKIENSMKKKFWKMIHE